MDRRSLRRLRAQPGYPALVGAATLARVSDEMFPVAAVLLVLERTGSPEVAGLVLSVSTVPSAITAPLLGAWLDLSRRRRSLLVLDQLVVGGFLLVLIAAVGHAPDWALVPISLAGGLTYPLSFGGFTSLVPALVPDELLPPANAIEATSFNIALVIGPLLAGALAAAFGPAWSVAAEAALAFAALALIVRVPDVAPPAPAGHARRLREVVRAGLRRIVAVPGLRAVTAAGAIGLGGVGLLSVAFPLFASEHLHAPPSAAGFLWAAFAAGSTLGALALVRVQRRVAPTTTVIAGLVAFGALMLLWPLAGGLAPMLVLVAVAALADGPVLAAQFAVRQQQVERALHGQVFTTAAGVKLGAFAIGSALGGPVASALGSAGALVVAGFAQLAAAGVGAALLRLPVRSSPAAS